MSAEPNPVDQVVNALKEMGAQGAIVLHEPGQFADADFGALLAAGWRWSDEVTYVAGKRIRTLIGPGVRP